MLRYWSVVCAAVVVCLSIPKLAMASQEETTSFEMSQIEMSQTTNIRQHDDDSPAVGLFDELNVTSEQKQEIQQIRDQHRVTLEQRQQQLKQVQQELNQLIASEAAKDQIRLKHEQLLQMTQDMKELNFDVMMQLRDILTPEQRARFAEIMQNRRITPNRNP
ncbi:MAG: Spy/CpxP family protein refolding chaperone [Microcoleaceae cyanobacterium]